MKKRSLTFDALRQANTMRLPQFKNAKGEPAHSEPDGSDWCLAQWCNAVLGELGEAANIIKKVERGDLTLDEARQSLADEYADVACYLDILAFRTGVDLGAATKDKWNRVSERVGSDVRLFDEHAIHVAASLSASCQQGVFKAGDIVRYGTGPTALMQLDSPHAGGWHGKQCMGGTQYASEINMQHADAEDLRVWEQNATWRRP